jgi:hypothetical protein
MQHRVEYLNPTVKSWVVMLIPVGLVRAERSYKDKISQWPRMAWRLTRKDGKQVDILKRYSPPDD